MSTTEELREKFEKWALDQWFDCSYTNSIDTDYVDDNTARMWIAWQAAYWPLMH